MPYTPEQQARINNMSDEEKEQWIDLQSLVPSTYSTVFKNEVCTVMYWTWDNNNSDVETEDVILVQLRKCVRALGFKIINVERTFKNLICKSMTVRVNIPHYLGVYSRELYSDYVEEVVSDEFEEDCDDDTSDDTSDDDEDVSNNQTTDEIVEHETNDPMVQL